MSTLFSEVFPVVPDTLPLLYAYRIDGPEFGDLHSVGGGIRWVVRKHMKRNEVLAWSRAKRCLLSSAELDDGDLQSITEACWMAEGARYRDLQSIEPAPDIPIDAQAYADFVAWGLWDNDSVRRHVEHGGSGRQDPGPHH